MKALAIDTTDSRLIVVLINDDKTYSSNIEVGKSGHSSIIIPTIQDLVIKANISIDQIECLGVVVGPGSFTGIRIGVSAMTAIAFANNSQRVSMSSFELLGLDMTKGIVGVDAGHGNSYIANIENSTVISTQFIEKDDNFDLSKVVFDYQFSREEAICRLFKTKIMNKQFVSVFEPYYLRKSQAEREKDEI